MPLIDPTTYADDRDAAIKAAASAGASWQRQAVAGLGSFPPGLRADAFLFQFLLTGCRSPLDEPVKPRAWAVVFKEALAFGLIERTGLVLRNRRRQLVLQYVTTDHWRVEAKGQPKDARRSAKRAEARADRLCPVCGEAIEAARSSRRYCSDKCRVAAHRARSAG